MAFLSSFYPQPVVKGTTAGTFAEGNDPRLSDARTPLSHTHGNISNTGTIGSTAGLPVVTTTSGAISTLALGTANQVLRVNSGATGVEFGAGFDAASPPAIGSTTPSTGAFTTLSAAPTSGSALTLTGGTVTASAPLIDASQTWNNGSVAFAGMRLNVTNTASASDSLLLLLQRDADTQFAVNRFGDAFSNYWRFVNLNAGMWVHSVGGQEVAFGASPNHWFTMTSTRLRLSGDISLGRSGALGQAVDCILVRDDAGTLAQRNAANAQTFRIYNTFTSATNFERLNLIAQTSGSFIIGTEKGLGGGTARALELRTDNVARLTIGSGGGFTLADAQDIAIGTTTGTKIGTATTQKIGFFDKTPVVQPTAVADATDAATVITQLNALLSRMRDLGLIAT